MHAGRTRRSIDPMWRGAAAAFAQSIPFSPPKEFLHMSSSNQHSVSRRTAAALMAAIAAGATAPGSVLAQGSKPPVKMRITVSTHPLLDFSVPVFVGVEQGFFQKEGVVIEEVVSSEGGGTTVRNILTGGLDIGLVSFPAAIQANLAGAPLKIVEGGERLVTTHTLVVPENSKINSLKDAVDQDRKSVV